MEYMNCQAEIPISKIAQELGISTTTVSRALSGRGRVSEGTRMRVLTYIETVGAMPHVHTSKYTDKKTMNICVTLPGEGDYAELPYFTRMMMTLYDYFVIRGYSIIPIKTRSDDILPLKELVKKHKVDGVILTRVLENCLDVKFLQEKEVPFVVIGSCGDETVYQVDVDQRGGCYDMTNLLLKMGIRRTALLCSDLRQTVSQNRISGYLEAMRENSLSVDRRLIFENAADRNVLEKAVGDVLKEQVECIVCSDDGICVSLMNYLRELGIVVPQDVQVASFYNSTILDEYYPAVTSIDFDIRELGKAAGGMLMNLLEQTACEKKKMLGYKLLIKESTTSLKKHIG